MFCRAMILVFTTVMLPTSQQKCLAHLRRHFLRLVQTPGRHNQQIGEVFVDLIDDAFGLTLDFQAANDCQQYRDWATQFQSQLKNTIDIWVSKAGATALNLLCKLRDKYDSWWYFLKHPEVPPDNNLAERALRARCHQTPDFGRVAFIWAILLILLAY